MKLLNFTKNHKLLDSLACLTTTVNLPPKLLGLWYPFFPRSKLIFICMNVSISFMQLPFASSIALIVVKSSQY